jgi:membrane protease YdiL (CAAX protease family)
VTALTENDTSPAVAWGPIDIVQTIGAVVLTILITFVGAAVILGATRTTGDISTRAGAATLAVSLVAELAMVVAVWWFAVRRHGASWTAIGFRSPNTSRTAIGVPITLFAAFFAVVLFSFAVFELGLRDPEDSSIPKELLSGSLLLALFCTSVVVAPLMEETFFRGFVFGGLRRSWGGMRAGAASAVIFGLAHPDLFLIVPVTILGVLLVLLYVWTDSLWGPIAVHAMFNALQLLPELLPGAVA